jgi:diguanylate cyclase (GGDEF)-like protein/PAS domain S-box-containing protein
MRSFTPSANASAPLSARLAVSSGTDRPLPADVPVDPRGLATLAARALSASGGALMLDGALTCDREPEGIGAAELLTALRSFAAEVVARGMPLISPTSDGEGERVGRFVTCAGTPLADRTGAVRGALLAYQATSHAWTADDLAALALLARLAVAALPAPVPSEHTTGLAARERARYAALLEAGGAGVLEIDLDGRITLANANAETLLGYGDLLGRDIHAILHTRWDGAPQHTLDRCPLTTTLRAGLRLGPEEAVLQASDGGRFYAEYAAMPLVEEGRIAGALIWFRDLSGHKQLEERLAQQAQTDPLTGLANRSAFTAGLQEAILRALREGRSLAIVLIDLDDFAAVNQRLGTAAGDRLLAEVGRRLQTCVRHGDIVARSDGDEFAVLLERVSNPDEAAQVAERLLAALRPSFSLAGGTVCISASAGIAVMEGLCAADDLLRAATAGLLDAKRAGKARVAFTPELPAFAEPPAAG